MDSGENQTILFNKEGFIFTRVKINPSLLNNIVWFSPESIYYKNE